MKLKRLKPPLSPKQKRAPHPSGARVGSLHQTSVQLTCPQRAALALALRLAQHPLSPQPRAGASRCPWTWMPTSACCSAVVPAVWLPPSGTLPTTRRPRGPSRASSPRPTSGTTRTSSRNCRWVAAPGVGRAGARGAPRLCCPRPPPAAHSGRTRAASGVGALGGQDAAQPWQRLCVRPCAPVHGRAGL